MKDEEEFFGSSFSVDFQEFKELVIKTTSNLRRMNEMQEEMHWQFGEPEWWKQFEKELEAATGWVSSHC